MRLVKLGCLVALALLILANDQICAQEIKISHQWAEGTDGRDRAARLFVQEAEGRAKDLKFRIYPN